MKFCLHLLDTSDEVGNSWFQTPPRTAYSHTSFRALTVNLRCNHNKVLKTALSPARAPSNLTNKVAIWFVILLKMTRFVFPVSLLLTNFLFVLSSTLSAPTDFQNSVAVGSINVPGTTTRNGIPVYGNWCGPGHYGGVCVDSIDCACKAHDKCIAKYGLLNCRCDNELVKALEGNKRHIAIALRFFFKKSPCRAPRFNSFVRFCKKCKVVFGAKVCTSVPCLKRKCSLTLIIARKSRITKYRC